MLVLKAAFTPSLEAAKERDDKMFSFMPALAVKLVAAARVARMAEKEAMSSSKFTSEMKQLVKLLQMSLCNRFLRSFGLQNRVLGFRHRQFS